VESTTFSSWGDGCSLFGLLSGLDFPSCWSPLLLLIACFSETSFSGILKEEVRSFFSWLNFSLPPAFFSLPCVWLRRIFVESFPFLLRKRVAFSSFFPSLFHFRDLAPLFPFLRSGFLPFRGSSFPPRYGSPPSGMFAFPRSQRSSLLYWHFFPLVSQFRLPPPRTRIAGLVPPPTSSFSSLDVRNSTASFNLLFLFSFEPPQVSQSFPYTVYWTGANPFPPYGFFPPPPLRQEIANESGTSHKLLRWLPPPLISSIHSPFFS